MLLDGRCRRTLYTNVGRHIAGQIGHLKMISYMFVKLFGFGLILLGSYLIYVKRNLQDDSLLLGSGLILNGLLISTLGWIVKLDSKRK